MMKIDLEIFKSNDNICKNISIFDDSERGLLSQNILAHLRNYIEAISVKLSGGGKDLQLNYENIKTANNYIKANGKYRFLSDFHDLLQISVSHYTLDEGSSERLMLKYYEYLLKSKIFLKETFNMEVLDNIDEFPLNTDTKLMEYYEKIADKISNPESLENKTYYTQQYYVRKIKPFFIHQKVYYEVTVTPINDSASKFDRMIAFTKEDISSNYAVKLHLYDDEIEIMGKVMPIQIINDWEVSIRPCELGNFAKLFGQTISIKRSLLEYKELMQFLKSTKMNFTELITASEEYYQLIISQLTGRTNTTHFIEILKQCRVLVMDNKPGSNTIRYLLFKLNNKVLKEQYYIYKCNKLSDLYLSYGCIPFDQMPFATALKGHNPRIIDLFDSLDYDGREHELFARMIKTNTEVKGILFTPKKDINRFVDIDKLIDEFNTKLYYSVSHQNRRLEVFKDHIYIKGYEENTVAILNELIESSSAGIASYSESVEHWLSETSYNIDCAEKKAVLKRMFENSRVSLIYGAAGTGKSTLINHISNFFNDYKKVYLANTNPAVDNLKRKVSASNCTFKTVKKFLSSWNCDTKCDILIVDESSTVSNEDMKNVLAKAEFELLVLVGDVLQIESIIFGNWFSLARSFLPEESIVELRNPYRTKDKGLLRVWNSVRTIDMATLERLVRSNYSLSLDESIFEQFDEDQIILCLNYDGLYGINNINRFLQGNNPSLAFRWGTNVYKVGDPILFNESERFMPTIYNNLKGKIVAVELLDKKIQFDVEIDKVISEFDTFNNDLVFVGNSLNGNSIVRFTVNEYKSTDEDDEGTSETVVPFQVAYAVSIHKAQGLEYNSVKVIVTNEVEELITHNIFYTAITRAKKYLKIYWTPETENKILKSLELKDNQKDITLLTLKNKGLNRIKEVCHKKV